MSIVNCSLCGKRHDMWDECDQELDPIVDGGVPVPMTTAEKMFLGLTDTQRLNALRKLCGFVENGSDTTVRIFQDDATRDWIVRCGEQRFCSNCLRGVLDEVFKYVDGLPE